MPLDPVLVPMLDVVNSATMPTEGDVETLRAQMNGVTDMIFVGLAEPAPEPARTEDRQIAVDRGEITVRVYTPEGDGPFPAHLYLHGGGFWLGTLNHCDIPCRDICAGTGAVVVAVDYRLAPEHKFPTPAEDCYAALEWVAANAEELRVDPSKISVGGGSAGGNLSAVVALMARDRGGPSLVFQVLEIPAVDLTMSFPSIIENGEGYMLTKQGVEQCVDYYLAEPADAKNPYASPWFADDLSGLPPALVVTAEFDPLRDEGEAYARRLTESGVDTTLVRMDGHIHGSMGFTAQLPSARAHRDRMIAMLRAAYA
jgi:acetyl esterase